MKTTLQRAIGDRSDLRGEAEASPPETGGFGSSNGAPAVTADTLRYLTSALHRTADDLDALREEAVEARRTADTARHDLLVLQQRTDRIFSQLEEAIALSIEPLDGAINSVGLSSESILDMVRRGYSGRGGPLTPFGYVSDDPNSSAEALRVEGMFKRLDRLNLYNLAMPKIPFAMPVKGNYRYTSGFGPRRGRMHYGLDLAAEYGKPINATADGVVSFAGWLGNYGRLVKIRHDFGIETRYAHLAKIRVKSGQRVSRGDRIGDMGSSGRSTGTHLHYEIRVDGKAINPMIYIRASKNVF